jgi:L-Ala-D/L-Glu epimerase
VPYPRYGETVDAVATAIAAAAEPLARGLDRIELQDIMPPGAARNAIDCALWDLAAKRAGTPVYALVGLAPPQPAVTAYTISLAAPEAMAEAAHKVRERKLLKVKLGAADDPARIAAVRSAAPQSELIVDANEGWSEHDLAVNLAACAEAGVTLIEQPLRADHDQALAFVPHPVPICADESVYDRASLEGLQGKYDAINIKLDKTGGLTEALALAGAAEQLGLAIMIGCMVSTSLAIAPATLLAQRARVVDLDGPLLLARDRDHGLHYEGSLVYPPTSELWG